MLRRQFLRNSLAGCGSFYLMGCGGGSTTSADNAQSAEALSILKAPAPAPSPTPAPAPAPTLRGVTIDAAENEIKSSMTTYTNWFATTRTFQVNIVVRSPDELVAAIAETHNAANLALHNRIVCDWNGIKSLASGEASRVNIGKTASTGHYAAGGSLRIEAAAGAKPAFANTVYVMGQGISLVGLTFARRVLPGETARLVNAVLAVNNKTYGALEPIISFEKCSIGSPAHFGLATISPGATGSKVDEITRGFASQGLATFIQMKECAFCGLDLAAQIIARFLRVDMCDFRQLTGDAIDLYGHSFSSDYYAYAWVSRITMRNALDVWEARNKHVDTLQICSPADIHKGYRVLFTDNFIHSAHSFAGDEGQGGGTQGLFGSTNSNTDNQFVVRRCVTLTTAPHGFCFYSPMATRPSFVDRCVHTRAGRTPSLFPGDLNRRTEDFGIGVTGRTPSTDSNDWLLVTNTIGMNMFTGAGANMDLLEVDPRAGAAQAKRPESVFAGPNFARGGAAANYMANKFAYDLPSEKGSQAKFIADIWANFRTKDPTSTYGIPNPTGLGWSL